MSDQPELPPELRALISGEKVAPAGSDVDRRMIGSRIAGTLGLAAPLGGEATAAGTNVTTAASATTAVAGTTAGMVLKIGIIVVTLGAVTTGGVWLASRDRSMVATTQVEEASPRSLVVPEVDARIDAELARPVPVASTAAGVGPTGSGEACQPSDAACLPAPPARRPTRRAKPITVTRGDASRGSEAGVVEDHGELVARAMTALTRGDASDALGLLARDRRLHPASELDEERDALEIAALTQLQRCDEARRAAERFRQRYPSSVHGARIDLRSCDENRRPTAVGE